MTEVQSPMTDTQHAMVHPKNRPVRAVGIQQIWVAAGGAIALVGFFLPWIKTWHIVEMGSDSGFSFARITDSVSSGNSLAILFVVLIAAALAVLSALYAGFTTLDARSLKGVCAVQITLAVAAIAVIALTVPSEIDTWTGLVIEYQFGIWMTIIGLAIVGFGGLVGVMSKKVE